MKPPKTALGLYLREYRASNNDMSQAELARRLGRAIKGKGTVSSLERGTGGTPKSDTLAALRKLTGLEMEILRELANSPPSQLDAILRRVGRNGPDKRRGVKVLGTAELDGRGGWSSLKEDLKGRIQYPSEDPDAYAVRVIGDALAPRYQSGEFILCQPNRAIRGNREVVVQLKNGSTYVRRFLSDDDGIVSFVSVNGGDPQTVRRTEIEHMHAISGRASLEDFFATDE
jgi:Predicted transcriptional regulator